MSAAQMQGDRRRDAPLEIVVDRQPAPPPGDEPVGARIERNEVNLRAMTKDAGATFDWSRKLWVMPRRTARRLGFLRRIAPRGKPSEVIPGKE